MMSTTTERERDKEDMTAACKINALHEASCWQLHRERQYMAPTLMVQQEQETERITRAKHCSWSER